MHINDNSNGISVNNSQNLLSVVPFTTSLLDGRLVVIDTMTDRQISDTYVVIQDAAAHGQDFGVDEHHSEEEFRHDLSEGHCFSVLRQSDDEMVAVFVLAVSRFYRGPSVADPFIIVHEAERGRGIGEFCLRMSVLFARHLNFLGMYVDTLSNNTAMLRTINGVGGFVQVACLPMGGKMKDGSIFSSIIFYRKLVS